MAEIQLSDVAAAAKLGTTDSVTGVPYPAADADPWLAPFGRFGAQLIVEATLANNLRVYADDSAGTTIGVRAGRFEIDGVTLSYAGGTVAGLTNNATNYVWAYNSTGSGAVASAVSGTGWPAYKHVKLAEVTLVSGAVTAILDRRAEATHRIGVNADVAALLATYSIAITVQGSIAGASTITITTKDANGNAIAAVDFLRVRVCNSAGYANATNATIAAGTNTTVVETLTSNKDLVLKSHTDGTYKVTLTDATPETVTLRIGAPTFGGRRADHTPTQNVTHA